ncbi:MAG: DUF4870 domain-containing protein [Culturomica sp.]|jgi:uncharacterized Tic20 family protein|nr:DUF4870 domain-containing protein [Culturomica sp.]
MELYNAKTTGATEEDKQYAMFLHLSQFAGLIIPIMGWVLPLVLWLVKKDTSAYIDQNGKVVMNWILSSLIYAFVGGILVLLLIGIPLLIALSICSLVFTILGALRARDGIIWSYPLSIRFFR